MPNRAHDLARRLARDAEAVCRHFLPNGCRQGRYWCVGDVDNSPGRSLFVRLTGPERGKGAAGKWTDAATGEHGDLLDLIAARRKLDSFGATLEEARAFLRLPRSEPERREPIQSVAPGSPEAARRLWAIARPIQGTLAETYLRGRGITHLGNLGALRFHPRCWYRGDPDDPCDSARDAWPALIASVRDNGGTLTAVHRTWLALDGSGKAPVSTPRRAIGNLLGHGVRFGASADVLAAAEGIETMLSVREALPRLPMIAGLSANHLAAIVLPPVIRRLYLARDADTAGRRAADSLAARAQAEGLKTVLLDPVRGDFNEDLRAFGLAALRARLREQLAPGDADRFMPLV
jgi:hypothetical protein